MNKRTKSTDISPGVRKIVSDRDNKCIFCGSLYGIQLAHYIPRSSGGLGIKENLTCACYECHHNLDQTTNRASMREVQKAYLERFYPEFPDSLRKFQK